MLRAASTRSLSTTSTSRTTSLGSKQFFPNVSSSSARSSLVSFRKYSTMPTNFTMILTEKKGKVGIVTLNRPKALNALCDQIVNELNEAMKSFELDKDIGCVILTGSKKAFAAGADIKEMSDLSYMDAYTNNKFSQWDTGLALFRKPTIAAVSGYALGGGCELAMMCDIIIASESAKFGQPEITLGTIPGLGGTQRLVRAIGKSKAMELVLTGNTLDAQAAERAGLVSRVVSDDKLMDSALETANKIASFSKPIVMMAKDCVNKSFEMGLKDSLAYERRLFHSTFATKDQKEGMSAFVAKKSPTWSDS